MMSLYQYTRSEYNIAVEIAHTKYIIRCIHEVRLNNICAAAATMESCYLHDSLNLFANFFLLLLVGGKNMNFETAGANGPETLFLLWSFSILS